MCIFNFLVHTLLLNYQPTLLETREEIAVVILWPIMNILDFENLKIKRYMCRFNFLAHTVELNYQPTLLETREEIAVVILGPIMNILEF